MGFLALSDLIELCQLEAIADKLRPSEESVFRHYCRFYSKTFHTPLEDVFKLDPIKVLQAALDERLGQEDEDEEIERYLDIIYAAEDPEYESQRAQEEDDYVLQAAEEEEERIRLGKPIHSALKGEHNPLDPPVPTTMPKSGGINLAYLEKEEQ